MSSPELVLTVLGCDGSYPGEGGASSGYLLSCSGTNVWMDAGSGTLANLQRYVAIEDLDAAVISHSHPDHWSDLDHFAVAARYVTPRRILPVFAAEGVRSLLRVGAAAEIFDWRQVGSGERVTVGALTFTFDQTDHPVTTLAMRVDGAGRSLGYSADTGPGWGLTSLGPALQLALCEATFLSDMEGRLAHLSAREAGRSAREAGVERLVLTHLWPRVDRGSVRRQAEEAFGGPVALAAVGDRYVA